MMQMRDQALPCNCKSLSKREVVSANRVGSFFVLTGQ